MQRYQKDLLTDNKNFAVEYLERSCDSQDHMLCGHCHSHFEIYVQTKGRRRYFLKNRVYEIEPGDVVFIAPGLVHKTSNHDKNPHARLLIEFDEKFLWDMDAFLGNVDIKSCLSHIYTNGYYIYRNTETTDQIIHRCTRINDAYLSELPFENMKARFLVAEWILDLIRETAEDGMTTDVGNRYKISEILSYINENYNKDISLKETSEKFYLSYYYLSRLFKEATGFTFVAYVNIVRVNKAKILIERTDSPIELISSEVGFGSQKQFVRVFKAMYGISPSKYKSSVKKKKDS